MVQTRRWNGWHDHPPAFRFNGGQKAIYWIVVLGGGAVAVSGYVLMFPFYGTDIRSMQIAEVVHAIVAVLFIAAMLGHIYIGTIGMEGPSRRWAAARRCQLGQGASQSLGRRGKGPHRAERHAETPPISGSRSKRRERGRMRRNGSRPPRQRSKYFRERGRG